MAKKVNKIKNIKLLSSGTFADGKDFEAGNYADGSINADDLKVLIEMGVAEIEYEGEK